jgi:hypothetical protein
VATQLLFEDLTLNASVPRDDELRLSRQTHKMLRFFCWCRRRNRLATTTDLMRFGAQYQGRLYEVRRHLIPRGFCIDRISPTQGRAVHFYKMVPRDESEWYKKRKDRL